MYWDYILSIIGVAGFILAGKKIWWAWYVNIGAQFVWFAYAIITQQYGFLIGSAIYFVVFVKNAYDWTKDHRLAIVELRRAEEHLKRTEVLLEEVEKSYIPLDEARRRVEQMYRWSVKEPNEFEGLNGNDNH